MRPGSLGRALGIGVRLATKRVAPTPAPPPSPEQQRARTEKRVRTGEALGRQARTGVRGAGNVARGGRNFGRAVWNPLAQASSILWLEITGMFFALFSLLFAQHLYTLRAAWRSGPEHTHFLIYAAFAGIFLYFALSSFSKARRRSHSR